MAYRIIARFRAKDTNVASHAEYNNYMTMIKSGILKDHLLYLAKEVVKRVENGDEMTGLRTFGVEEERELLDDFNYKGIRLVCRSSEHGVFNDWYVELPPIYNTPEIHWEYCDYYACWDAVMDYGFLQFKIHVNGKYEGKIEVYALNEHVETIKIKRADTKLVLCKIDNYSNRYAAKLKHAVERGKNVGDWTNMDLKDMACCLIENGYQVQDKNGNEISISW